MFYQELYPLLGKLFYYIAAADGEIQLAEKESLHQLIQRKWKPLENSTDRHGTDMAYLIDFSFDYLEAEGQKENIFQSFKMFYQENKSRFTPPIIDNIIQTSKAIASAYPEKNGHEQDVLSRIIKLFESGPI